MKSFRAGIITFPGSNCDRDMLHILTHFYGAEARILWHGDLIDDKFDLLVLPGGFSYGDYLRSGSIARFAPAMKSLQEHVKRGGAVLGICNGFQILCEAHLLPGVLMRNISLKHIAKPVGLQIASAGAVSHLNAERTYTLPVSHGDGNYRVSEEGLKELQDQNRVLFRYTENPNGSMDDIAGICDKAGKIAGMMPHPERAVDPIHGAGTDGKEVLDSLLATLL